MTFSGIPEAELVIPESELVDHQFHINFFGIPHRFPTWSRANGWVTVRFTYGAQPSVWHGTTLSQLHEILQSGVWKPGLWHPATQNSPLGVWVTSSPSMAIDRACMRRGYGVVPDGWDCPVAIGFDLPGDLMTRHGRPLANGVDLLKVRVYGRTQVPLWELNAVEVTIFEPHRQSFSALAFGVA